MKDAFDLLLLLLLLLFIKIKIKIKIKSKSKSKIKIKPLWPFDLSEVLQPPECKIFLHQFSAS
ncbi:hypothetical protein QUF72_17245, partial [Desulfobacterales bacterium HSG2]|nr:hypothetical protein [Desulfobacterales bacterium HSG2]